MMSVKNKMDALKIERSLGLAQLIMSEPPFVFRRQQVEPAKTLTVNPINEDNKPKRDEKSIFVSLKLFVLLAQIFGILPQENVNTNIKEPYFKWRSWRLVYSMIIISLLGFAVACGFVYWVLNGSSITSIALAVFYGGSFVTTILYLHLAISWSKLMKSWYSIDKMMNISYGYPKTLDRKIKIFIGIFLTLGIVDLLLNIGNRYEQLTDRYAENMSASIFYNDTFPQLFAYVPFSIPSAIFCTLITVHSNITWALNDLFIIITSTALAMRFQQICQRLNLESHKYTNNSLTFWKQIREDYDRLASFCKELDAHISAIVLLSYFLNIFFLLIQLYHSLESISLILGKIYFIFSFGYLIFKTTMVSLYAAWINDESKSPVNILNSVDSSLYNVEIRRLLMQISFDKTSLTGCKMFSVKRGIILSVASAIVTYELVLIQFSQANLYDSVS